ncbi:ricin B lectin domain-containing protein [Cyathus striatus]|nr:ricin B lectin domain-containing protein [Cyathus striatus]
MFKFALALLFAFAAGTNGFNVFRAASDIVARQAAPVPVRIHPASASNPIKCLDVRGGLLANGTPVQLFDCNGTPAQNWLIQPGQTAVQLNGTNFCLDAGSTPGSGVLMKIWECFADLPAQEWFLTADNRIALLNQGQCLDVPNGNLADGTQVQIFQCTDNDANQVWLNY